ncbi:MAG: hypothetical protein ACREOO_20100 [bacterium]
MSKNLAEIVHPLVKNGLYENAELAVKDLMANHILRQIDHYRAVSERFEKKYAMTYVQFNRYLHERARTLSPDPSAHQQLMLEEEDAFDWKVATEMLASWLGLQGSTGKVGRTTYRSTTSNKRYAVRDAQGRLKEAKTNQRAPRQNQKRKSKNA